MCQTHNTNFITQILNETTMLSHTTTQSDTVGLKLTQNTTTKMIIYSFWFAWKMQNKMLLFF